MSFVIFTDCDVRRDRFLFSCKLPHKLFVKGAQTFQYFFHGVCGGHDAKSAKTNGSVEYLCCVTLT